MNETCKGANLNGGVYGGMLPGTFVKISLRLVHSERFCEYKFQPHQGISRIIN